MDTSNLARFSQDEKFTKEERLYIMAMHGRTGDFFRTLFEAIERADTVNLERLRAGFPKEVAAQQAWRNGDLSDRIRAAGYVID